MATPAPLIAATNSSVSHQPVIEVGRWYSNGTGKMVRDHMYSNLLKCAAGGQYSHGLVFLEPQKSNNPPPTNATTISSICRPALDFRRNALCR